MTSMTTFMSADLRPRARLPLLVLGVLSLAAGVLGGLARLAFEVPAVAADQAGVHGALMISAFFGTVISLERAVALGRRWAYLAPAGAGAGGLALLGGLPGAVPHAFFVGAAAILVAASAVVMRRHAALFTATLMVAALCWLAGNLAWAAGHGLDAAVPWWLAFLVLTIAGERLELTRLLPAKPAAAPLFVAIAGLILLGAAAALWHEAAGARLFAAGLLALSVWLLRYDIARHNARQRGLARFIAICLLSGYVWLALGALFGLAGGFEAGHPLRDAALHSILLGFVFAMVFGHAPIIFPAVARVRIPYHPLFYVPLACLHGSLAMRIAGTAFERFALLQWGALLNALTLLLFVVTMVGSVARGRLRGAP
jgi:hypothetical protein